MPNAAPISLHTNSRAFDHPRGLDEFRDELVLVLDIGDVVDFGETFRFQLFHQVFHISVQRFLGKHVLKGKKPRLF